MEVNIYTWLNKCGNTLTNNQLCKARTLFNTVVMRLTRVSMPYYDFYLSYTSRIFHAWSGPSAQRSRWRLDCGFLLNRRLLSCKFLRRRISLATFGVKSRSVYIRDTSCKKVPTVLPGFCSWRLITADDFDAKFRSGAGNVPSKLASIALLFKSFPLHAYSSPKISTWSKPTSGNHVQHSSFGSLLTMLLKSSAVPLSTIGILRVEEERKNTNFSIIRNGTVLIYLANTF